jgi:DNA-binding transcriptional LysR family regulator
VRFDLRAGLRSEEIVEGLRAHELDAGIIHTAPEVVRGQRVTTVGSVRFAVVGVPALFRERFGALPSSLSGADLAISPVAVLSPGMLAREEFDRAMSELDVQVTPVLDSDSVAALLSSAEAGRWFAVVPEWAPLSDRLCAVPLVDPEVRLSIAVSRLDIRPVTSVARAVDAAAAEVAAEVAVEVEAAGGASS